VERALLPLAIQAAISRASALGLSVEDAVLVHNSNRIAVRLLPCNVLARIASERDRLGAHLEVEIARLLADGDSSVALLEPRVAPSVYETMDFVITFWTYYEHLPGEIAATDYARALNKMHACMRAIADPPAPHFTTRAAEALRLVGDRDRSPNLSDVDRHFLRETLERLTREITRRGAAEQLLHGEPHVGNLMRTTEGLLFMDLETCCRGPVEFDVAHAPEEVSKEYPGLDRDLLRDCRELALAMVATWRWDRDDQLPDGRYWGRRWIKDLRLMVD
jgi:aminoglycoside phosphotransferase (APT) family kinase protein